MFSFCFWIHFKSNNYPHSPIPPLHFYASFPVFMAWTTISMRSNSDTDYLLSSFGHVTLKHPQSLHEINVPLYLYLGSQARNLPLRVLPTLLFSTFFQLAMGMKESFWPTSLKPQPPLVLFQHFWYFSLLMRAVPFKVQLPGTFTMWAKDELFSWNTDYSEFVFLSSSA